MDEISQEPKHELRLPPGPPRWLTGVVIAGLIAALAVFGITRLGGGQHSDRMASVPTATASPNPEPDIRASLLPVISFSPMPPGGPLTILPFEASPTRQHRGTRHG